MQEVCTFLLGGVLFSPVIPSGPTLRFHIIESFYYTKTACNKSWGVAMGNTLGVHIKSISQVPNGASDKKMSVRLTYSAEMPMFKQLMTPCKIEYEQP